MLRKLEAEGFIKKLKSSPRQIEDSIKLAERDLEVAKTVLDNNYDWTFNIAYNSILQSIRALIYKKGYRISSRNSHLATISFAEIFLDEADVLYFDRMRRKRHQAVYDTAGTISKTEAQNAISRAEIIINKVKKFIRE